LGEEAILGKETKKVGSRARIDESILRRSAAGDRHSREEKVQWGVLHKGRAVEPKRESKRGAKQKYV